MSKFTETMIKKHGSREKWIEHLKAIGSKGGQRGITGGFASDVIGKDGLTGRERAKIAGSKGGKNRTGWRKIMEGQE